MPLGCVTPEAFGAEGLGVADDTGPLRQAIESGRPVILPGRYRITEAIARVLSAETGPLAINGLGVGQVILDSPAATLAFNVGPVPNPWGMPAQAITLEGFTIVPRAISSMAALHIGAQPCSGSSMPTFAIRGVHVIPWSPAYYTVAGFNLRDLRNGTISDCVIMGRYGQCADLGAIMLFASASPRSNPVDIHIRDCQGHWYSSFVHLQGEGTDPANPSDWQGVHIRDCTALACDRGVNALAGDKFAALLQVQGCHFNVFTFGIYAPNVWHPRYSGNNFIFGGTNPAVTAIEMSANGQPWPILGHVKDNVMYFGRNPPLQVAVGINAGAISGGGAFTVIGDNTMQKGNCATLVPVQTIGSTVYDSGNRSVA